MKIANGAECARRGFHGVASSRAVDMEIDETGREIVSLPSLEDRQPRTAFRTSRSLSIGAVPVVSNNDVVPPLA